MRRNHGLVEVRFSRKGYERYFSIPILRPDDVVKLYDELAAIYELILKDVDIRDKTWRGE
jgi:hypothetical protein